LLLPRGRERVIENGIGVLASTGREQPEAAHEPHGVRGHSVIREKEVFSAFGFL